MKSNAHEENTMYNGLSSRLYCGNFKVFSDNIHSVHGGSQKGNGLLAVY